MSSTAANQYTLLEIKNYLRLAYMQRVRQQLGKAEAKQAARGAKHAKDVAHRRAAKKRAKQAKRRNR